MYQLKISCFCPADLFAAEAQYHRHCHISFNTKYYNHVRAEKRTEIRTLDTEQVLKAAAHEEAFKSVADFIEDHVIVQNEVVQLSSLRLLYINELENHGYPQLDYRSEKLRSRIEDHPISRQIAFAKVNPGDKGFITFNLVYNASISVADAVAYMHTNLAPETSMRMLLSFSEM